MACIQVETVKVVLQIELSPNHGACPGGNSKSSIGNKFSMHYRECSLAKNGTFHRHLGHTKLTFKVCKCADESCALLMCILKNEQKTSIANSNL